MAFPNINDSIINTHINNNSQCNLSIGLKISGKGLRDTSNANNIYDYNGIGFQLWSNSSNNRELAIIDTSNATNSNYSTLRLGITQAGATIKSITSNNTYRPLIINDYLTITSNRVGIGTTNPLNSLDVRGNITLDGNLLRSDGSLFTNSQWSNAILNSNNIYYNLGNVGIGTTNPIASLDIRNGNVILDSNSRIGIGITNPQYAIDINNGNVNIGGNLLISLNNTINNYNIYTSNSSITFSSNTTTDLLLVGAGGNGGGGSYAGGGGAGEVIYYPNYLFTTGTYNLIVGSNSTISSNRISKLTLNNNDIIRALGGGDGGGLQIINTNTSIVLSQNTTIKYNYGSDVAINAGSYNITFANGAINITGLTADYSYPILKDSNGNIINPLAWYKFDNANLLADSSGNNYTLTNSSIVSLTTTNFTKGNSSAIFNGSSLLYISYTNNLFTPQNGWSISFWAYIRRITTLMTLISTRPSNEQNLNGYTLYLSDGGLAPMYGNNTGIWYGGGGAPAGTISNTNFQWYHIIWISKIGLQQTYINGVLVGSGTDNMVASVVSGIGDFQIGAIGRGTNYIIENGACIDDVRIYSGIALSQQQINELYTGRVEIYQTPSSGGSGGGGTGGLIIQIGASQGIKNSGYSLINAGITGSSIKGGDGGSAATGGYTEILTGSNLNIGVGGNGALVTTNPIVKLTYGSGGDGGGGLGTNGLIIIKYISKKIGLGIGTTQPLSALDVRGNVIVSGSILKLDGSLYNPSSINSTKWVNALNYNSNIYYNTGFVGIGTNNPQAALDVKGNIIISGTITKTSGGTFNSSQWSNSIINSNNIFYNLGNIGIGTINPQSLLHLASANSNTDIIIRFTDNSTGHTSNNGLIIRKDNTQSGVLWNYQNTSLIFGTNNSEKLRITSNGNVGIGTTNPQSILHLVASTINTNVNIQFTDATTGNTTTDGFIIQKNSSQSGVLWNYENADFIIGNNNTERLRIKNTGNVGIGTTNPLSLLHLYKTGTSQDVLLLFNDQSTGGGAINGVAIGKSSDNSGILWNYQNAALLLSTNNSERLRITSNGNIGIGTTNPQSLLHLAVPTSNTNINIQFTDATTGNTATDGFIVQKDSSQSGLLWNYENADLIFGNNNIERLRIKNTGNVGIGTTNPLSLLHLYKIGTSQDVLLLFNDQSTGGGTTNGIVIGKSSDNSGILWNYQNTSLIFGTNNSERLRITSNGNIGIGTTNPQSLLHLAATTANTNVNIQLTDATTGNTATDGVIVQKDSLQNAVFWNYENADLIFGNNNIERLRIKNTGNVGIGTTNPLSLLHLYKTGTSQDVLLLFNDQSTGGGATNGFVIGKSSDNLGILWNYQNTPLIFGTNNTETFRINSNGNVGIGTTNPQYLLDVNGNVNCEGGIAIAGANTFLYNTNIDDVNSVNTYITFKPANSVDDWCYLRQIGTPDAYKLSFDFYDNINDSRFAIRYITPNGIAIDTVKEVFAVDGSNVFANTLQLNGENTSNTIFQQTGNLGISVNNTANYINFNVGNLNEVMRITNSTINIPGGKKLVFTSTSNNNPSIGTTGNANGDRIIFKQGYNYAGGYPSSIGIGISSLWYSVQASMNHAFYINGIEYVNINTSSLGIKTNLEISNPTNPRISFTSFGNTDIAVATDTGRYSTSAVNGDMVIRSQTGKNLILQNGDGAGHLIINNGKIGLGTITPQSALDIKGDITLSGQILKADGSVYEIVNTNLVANSSSNLVLKTNIITSILPSYKYDSNLYYFIEKNNSIKFTADTYCDILLVGAGGNGGIASPGISSPGGGGAGEIIYYPNYLFSAGNYDLIVGSNSIYNNANITKIIFNNTDLIKANNGGNGGGIMTINTYKTITIATPTYFSYNYIFNTSFLMNNGSYIITFNNGAINISTFSTDYSYPILKNPNGTNINPILWYKFENSSTFLNENFYSSNNLINNGATFNTTSYIKGSGSISFSKSSSQYATIPNNNIDFNSINIANGISFSFWFRMANTSSAWARVFDFGTRGGDNNASSCISFYRNNTDNYVGLLIKSSKNDGNTTDSQSQVSFNPIPIDNTWRHLTFTFSSTGIFTNYINSAFDYQFQAMVIPKFTLSSKYYFFGKSLFLNDAMGFDGNIDDFRIYDFVLSQDQIKELYSGRVDIYTPPTSGGCGGGGYGINFISDGATQGTKNNVNSLLADGNRGTLLRGGDGGSIGYTETITGLNLNIGFGGLGSGTITLPSAKKTYGNGGDGGGGIGGNGLIIIKPVISKTISVSDTKLLSLNVSNINNSIIQNTVYPILSSSLYNLNYINNKYYGYYIITSNISITFKKDTIVDLLAVGAGGNGGLGTLSGGGGAGEVIYYPNYSFNFGTYNIQIGSNYSNPNLKNTIIYDDNINYIIAKGGGNGVGTNLNPIITVSSGSIPTPINVSGSTTEQYILLDVNSTLTFNVNILASFVLVGGGGGGGGGNSTPLPGAGGGAGQYIYSSNLFIPAFTTINIIIGSGGIGGTSSSVGSMGNNSSISINNNIIFTALGGGGATLSGASGGGNGGSATILGITGYNGGTGSGAGGGGAGGTGNNYTTTVGAAGGIGINLNITGTTSQICGGGSGGSAIDKASTAGIYGGGRGGGSASTGRNGYNATSYGSGGGGGGFVPTNINDGGPGLGGAGYKGVFIIRYSIINYNEEQYISTNSNIGSGGGSYANNNSITKGTNWNVSYSLLNNGNVGTASIGGSGGSALSTGGYSEIITETNILIGIGGNGATSSSTPTIKTNYGSGGDGNGGLGKEGVVIIKFPIENITSYNGHYLLDDNTYVNANETGFIRNYNTNNIYYNRGFVGIGISTPLASLHVNSNIMLSGNISNTNQNGFLIQSPNSIRFAINNDTASNIEIFKGSTNFKNQNVSITGNLTVSGNINITGGGFYQSNGVNLANTTTTFSDYRIKTNIIDINDDNALRQILAIKPKTFNYIDINERGSELVYGFIAQDVKEIIPDAVKIETQFIPNIYKSYDYSNNEIIINEDLNDKLRLNDKILIRDDDDYYKSAIINYISSNNIKVDIDIKGNNCFIYGKEIKDFHTLDKSYIYTLNVCATHDLYRLMEQQQSNIDIIKTKIIDRQSNIQQIYQLLQQ